MQRDGDDELVINDLRLHSFRWLIARTVMPSHKKSRHSWREWRLGGIQGEELGGFGSFDGFAFFRF